MLDKIGDLPAHPLIVHLPVVLGPVVGLLTLALLVPRWRPKLLTLTAALAVVFAISAALAVISGHNFVESGAGGPGIRDHEEAGELLRNLGILLAIVLVLVAAGFRRLGTGAQTAALVVVAILGVGTIAQTVKTGHLGAEQVWKR